MTKKQVTIMVTVALTTEFDIPKESIDGGFSMEEEVDTFVQELDYRFSENPDYLGRIVDTEIVEHSIGSITDIKEPEETVIDKVLKQIKHDVSVGDLTAIAELLSYVPNDILVCYLPE